MRCRHFGHSVSGSTSDTVEQLTARLAAADADVDTLRSDLATVRLDHAILLEQKATLDSILSIKDSTIAAQDTRSPTSAHPSMKRRLGTGAAACRSSASPALRSSRATDGSCARSRM